MGLEKGVASLSFLGPQALLAPLPLGASLLRGQRLPFSWLSLSGPLHRPVSLAHCLPQTSPTETELEHLVLQGPFPD